MDKKYYLVLDAGTTGVKALVFDSGLNPASQSYFNLAKSVKGDRVEQNPEEILKKSLDAIRAALSEKAISAEEIISFGITNQRETIIAWNKNDGTPASPAIVWEDKRTGLYCRFVNFFHGKKIRRKTGLRPDSYFSASKINWLIKNNPAVKKLLSEKNLAVGTVDSWLIFNLLENSPHLTDKTNASRTLLFNIKENKWDEELLKIFDVPLEILPEVKSSSSLFGNLKNEIIGLPISLLAVMGDQESSLYAAGNEKGTTKITYGTGAFIMQDIGQEFLIKKPFFTTLTATGSFALEAKVEGCGAKIAPLVGTPKIHAAAKFFIKKTSALVKKLPIKPEKIILDGGMTQYEKTIPLQNELTGLPVEKQKIHNGTALGVAKLLKDSIIKNSLFASS